MTTPGGTPGRPAVNSLNPTTPGPETGSEPSEGEHEVAGTTTTDLSAESLRADSNSSAWPCWVTPATAAVSVSCARRAASGCSGLAIDTDAPDRKWPM